MTKTGKRWIAVFAVTIITVGIASAGTIVSVSGTPSGISYTINSIDYVAISWTQTSSYTGVGISVELQGSGTGEAYLMTAIGAGTTSASQIASAPITFPGSAAALNIFSGLSLGAGGYYLLLSGNGPVDSTSGWSIPATPTYTTDFDVTRPAGYYYTNLGPVSYPPAAVYTDYPFDNAGEPIYSVTGTLVTTAEPQTGALVGLVLGLILARRSNAPQ